MVHVSTGAAASIAISELDRVLLVRSLDAKEKTDFRAHSKIGRLHINQFLKWIRFLNDIPTKTIADVIRAEASTGSEPLKLIMFASIPDPNLQDIDTKQV